uniref:Testicular haploid expressed gene protein-like n=1 Tax=Glossina brevipalpis TaxID=37001 RepID=A0A1A9W3T2_9MUSC
MLSQIAAGCFRICGLPDCIWNDIACSYAALVEKHVKSLTRRQRLWHLAKPRDSTPKYGEFHKPFFEAFQQPKTTIIRTYEIERENTRTVHLAYPKVNRLATLKSHTSYPSFEPQRRDNIDRLMKRSLLSLYSHLSKTKLPPKQKVKIARNKEENIKYVEGLAQPKKDHSKIIQETSPIKKKKSRFRRQKPQQLDCEKKKTEEPKPPFKRYEVLSKPKEYYIIEHKEWQLTPGLKNYVPSTRLNKIAQPRTPVPFYKSHNIERPISRTALKYQPSERLKQLAKSKRRYNKKIDGTKSPAIISPAALRAVATERIVKLAIPKFVMDMTTKSEPFRVPRRALRAHATEHTRNLAIPRSVRPKYVPPT